MADKDDRDTSLSGRGSAGPGRGSSPGGPSVGTDRAGGSRGAPSSGGTSSPSSSAGGGGSREAPSSGRSTSGGVDRAGGSRSTSGGGFSDTAGGSRSTIGGGFNDLAGGSRSTATGFSPDLAGASRSTVSTDNVDLAGPSRSTMQGGLYTSDAMRAADLASQQRAAEIASMASYDTYRATDLAAKNRAAENQSMVGYQAAREALLDTIAGTESPDYNVLYGGKTFNSYADHPRIGVEITVGPNKGLKSTAAGKYQFLEKTWDRVAQELGLTDFSPQSQDIAAAHLAAQDYKAATGRSLDADLAAGNIDRIASGLSGTWTSLPGGIEQTTTVDRFSREYASNFAARSDPKSQVANSGSFPATTSAIPTTRASFGEKYLGETTPGGFFSNGLPARSDVVPTPRSTLGNGLPDDIGVTPTSRPSPVASAFTGRPDVPVGSLPAARMETTVAGRPDVPVGSLPAARQQTTVAGRPDVPVGSLPAARTFEEKYLSPTPFAGRPDVPVGSMPAARADTTIAGRPDVPVGSMPAARTGTTVAGRPDVPVGGLPAARQQTTVAGRPDVPVGSLPAAPQQTTIAGRPDVPVGSLPAAQFPGRSRGLGGSIPSPARAAQDVKDVVGPVGMGGPGGLYVGAPPGARADQASEFDAPPSQVDKPADEPAYIDDETRPIGDLPASASPATPSTPKTAATKKEEDTITEKVLAGGLDILGGFVPVVGTGLSVVNAGLALTGNKTIGERLADYIMDGAGNNQYAGLDPSKESGSGGYSQGGLRRRSRFASKYLEPQTPTGEAPVPSPQVPGLPQGNRPTPKQKWIDARDAYAG